MSDPATAWEVWRVRAVWRAVAVYTTAILLVLGAFETAFRLGVGGHQQDASDQGTISGTYSQGYFEPDSVLGYAPRRPGSFTATRVVAGATVYDVVYTIDDDGLRVAPPCESTAGGSLLFFGDSFTFGEGVEDDETLPFRTGLEMGGRLRVYNFGFHGYGPHQMLAGLESGMVRRVVTTPPSWVIYQALPGHHLRSAGLSGWDRSGPRYLLDGSGSAVRRGTFADGEVEEPTHGFFARQLLRSHLVLRLLEHRAEERRIDRFIAIVAAARVQIGREFPGCELHVLLWDVLDTRTSRVYARRLERQGVRVHNVSDVLATDDYRRSPFVISTHDAHPGPNANRKLARYVAEHIVGVSVAGAGQSGRASRRLTVKRSGDGAIRSSPSGILCGDACTADFPLATVVVLAALPAPSSRFAEVDGSGCLGGVVRLDHDRTCTARFEPLVVGTKGDLDGDGRVDLLLRNPQSGENAVVLMKDAIPQRRVRLAPLGDPSWQIGGAADFNRDGRSDLLWRHRTSGANAVWLMSGTSLIEGVYLTTAPPNWRMVGTGDVDKDGQSDIVWQDSSGRVVAWVMQGTSIDRACELPTAPPGWSLVATADFDVDGHVDLLWRDERSGANAVWFLAGTTLRATAYLPPVGRGGYEVAAVGDFDRDGSIDLVWQGDRTEQTILWLMRGTTIERVVSAEALHDSGSSVVGPR